MQVRSKAILSVVLAAASAVAVPIPPAGATPAGFPVQYMVKFVCGFVPAQPPGEEAPLKPGNYATAINIHDFTGSALTGSKRVALHYRAGTPLPPRIPAKSLWIARDRVVEIDCPDIWAMVGVPPGTFLKGMVHVGLPVQLPVAAVYTAQTQLVGGAPPDVGAGMSIDVENISPFIAP